LTSRGAKVKIVFNKSIGLCFFSIFIHGFFARYA
jgi:hypothetical protein